MLILDLIELTKNVLLHVLGDADAGVLYCDVDGLGAVLVTAKANHAHQHMARGGEFDRVAHKVRQDLADAPTITRELRRQEQVIVDQDIQILVLRGRLQQHHHIMDRALQIERLGLERQFLGLDLRVIQNVVQQGQQRLTRMADGFGIEALFLAEFRIAEQFGHTNDAIHRRAQLVAHVREERGFGAVCAFGGDAGFI